VVLLGLEERGAESQAIGEMARTVARLTRRGDISCRRGERELAILLPGTEESGASVLVRRLRDAVGTAIREGTSTVTVGLVERLPAETPEALDARVEQTLGHPRQGTVRVLDDARNSSTAVASTVRSTLATGADRVRPPAADALRRDALEALARELEETRGFGRSLAIVVLEIAGLDHVSERLGRETADVRLGELAGRLDRSLSSGSVHRLGRSVFCLVLPGTGIDDAEALVDALQTSLGPPHDHTGLVLSAGITELTDDDDPDAGLGRAEHAVWQATQAGPGTIVVAVPNRRPIPPR
jgi:GGDEF domain-containing protein